ncbi:MAG: hypothetical protein IT558_03970 [Alphaproteobacteria bacterium]|nr:hypothetical protein [Alphaproteobacteria bacterium]
MKKKRKKEPVIKLERGAPDHILPRDFMEIISRRYLPVLSLTYISSLIGIAAQKGDTLHYIFEDKSAYVMAMCVALWVSIPAVFWIIIRGMHLYNHVADFWYKFVAALMVLILGMSYILFPDMEYWGVRVYLAASIPVFFIMYFLFVKGDLPAAAAHPLTALGFTFFLYGGIVNYLH